MSGNFRKTISFTARLNLALFFAIGIAVFSNTATAQDAGEETLVLEEVIVTATKRAESLQDIAVAVSALSADMIESLRIVSIEDITSVATSLNWQRGLTASNSTISIRGFGTNSFGTGVESSVSIVQDGVALSRQNEAFGEFFDLERIEVLRGPQGTLYGKNASAGVVQLISKAPTEEFEGTADLYYGSFDEVVARVALSGGLSESGNVKGRVSAYYKTLDGNINNVFNGEKLNGIDHSVGIRGKLGIDVSDNFRMMIIADYSDYESNCCGEPFRTLPPNTGVFGDPNLSVNDSIGNPEISETSLDTSIEAPTFGNYSGKGLSVEANWDFEQSTLTSITSYREWGEETNADIDWSPQEIFLSNGGSKDQDTFTQELRLNSSSDSPWQYIAGLYYYDNSTAQDFNRLFVWGFTHDLDTTVDTRNYAGFGELSYDFDTGTRVVVGGRWLDEKISYTAKAARTGFDTTENPQVPTTFSDSDSTLKLGIQQAFGESNMAYFTFSQGYKGMALDLTSGINETAALRFPIAPETVDSLEIGLKSELLNRRLRLNVAVFDMDFKNFQTQAFDSDALAFRILNAGDVSSKGLEIETQFAATEELTLTANATFQDIEITELVAIGCYAGQTEEQGCVQLPNTTRKGQDIVGAPLPNSPDTKIYLAAEYVRPFGNYMGFFNLNYTWLDDVQFQLNQNPMTIQDSYGIANFSFGLRGDVGFEATLFVNNLFDESYVSGIRAPGGIWGGSTGTVHQIPHKAQRTWGIRVGYNF